MIIDDLKNEKMWFHEWKTYSDLMAFNNILHRNLGMNGYDMNGGRMEFMNGICMEYQRIIQLPWFWSSTIGI